MKISSQILILPLSAVCTFASLSSAVVIVVFNRAEPVLSLCLQITTRNLKSTTSLSHEKDGDPCLHLHDLVP